MTDIQALDANQLIAEIKFDELCDEYFAQPREARGLTQLEEYFEQHPEDRLVDERNKNFVTMTLQAAHMCARRSSVPVNALPRFMQFEIKPVSRDVNGAKPTQAAPTPIFAKPAYA